MGILEAHRHSPPWKQDQEGWGHPHRGPWVLKYIHSMNVRRQSPWLFGCRFLFVVTYGCLLTAAVPLNLISLLPAASVARIVQTCGQLLEAMD